MDKSDSMCVYFMTHDNFVSQMRSAENLSVLKDIHLWVDEGENLYPFIFSK